jgi:hypothetical protein
MLSMDAICVKLCALHEVDIKISNPHSTAIAAIAAAKLVAMHALLAFA